MISSEAKTDGDLPPQERREQLKARERRTRRLAGAVIGFVLTGAILIPAAMGAMTGPSVKTPDRVEAFKTFTIGPSTNMRSEHAVMNEDGGNLYDSLDETITLTAKRFVTEGDEANGDWYKVPVSNIKAEDPDFKLRTELGIPVPNGDKKSVWINTQGAQEVPDISSTETTPTK